MLLSTVVNRTQIRSRLFEQSRRRSRRLFEGMAAAALLAVAAGCSTSESIAPMSATGNWVGTFSNFGTPTTLTVLLLDKTGTVTGNGTFALGTSTVPVNVSGTFVSPTLSVTVTSQGFANMNLTARVSSTSLDALLNGSGFLNQAITLTRQ
jgi:hypothetical protein